MIQYKFWSKADHTKEPVSSVYAISRLQAAKKFAQIKQLALKLFLSLYSVSR